MPRVKRGVKGARRRKRILKQAKGYFSARSRLLRTAKETVENALKNAYTGRKLKKRDFRRLWQVRISAAANGNGISYSAFMGNLKKKRVELDRKVLSEIAMHQPEDFKAIIDFVK